MDVVDLVLLQCGDGLAVEVDDLLQRGTVAVVFADQLAVEAVGEAGFAEDCCAAADHKVVEADNVDDVDLAIAVAVGVTACRAEAEDVADNGTDVCCGDGAVTIGVTR